MVPMATDVEQHISMAMTVSSPEDEREFTDSQVEESGRLMEEMPRIDAALKNFLSLKMAEGLAPSLQPESGSDAPGTTSSSPAAPSAALQGCARVILKVPLSRREAGKDARENQLEIHVTRG